VHDVLKSDARDPQGPASRALRPSSTVKIAPHFGHFTFASLLTVPLFILAHPAKLTINANANNMFASLFIARPPFFFPMAGITVPWAFNPLPMPVDVPAGFYRWDSQ
jgi:hypothetical protein